MNVAFRRLLTLTAAALIVLVTFGTLTHSFTKPSVASYYHDTQQETSHTGGHATTPPSEDHYNSNNDEAAQNSYHTSNKADNVESHPYGGVSENMPGVGSEPKFEESSSYDEYFESTYDSEGASEKRPKVESEPEFEEPSSHDEDIETTHDTSALDNDFYKSDISYPTEDYQSAEGSGKKHNPAENYAEFVTEALDNYDDNSSTLKTDESVPDESLPESITDETNGKEGHTHITMDDQDLSDLPFRVDIYEKTEYQDIYHAGENRLPDNDNLIDRVPADMSLLPSPSDPSKTVFMFRSEKSSRYTDLFTVHEKAIQVCDKDTAVGGCSIRLKHNYGYNELSVKLVETLDYFCQMPEEQKTDLYVKIDDDTIVPESELNLITRAMKASGCQYVGHIIPDYKFYYASGEIYMFTRAMLDRVCDAIPNFTVKFFAEDTVLGELINTTNTNDVCNLYFYDFWHKHYVDNRIEINYLSIHDDM